MGLRHSHNALLGLILVVLAGCVEPISFEVPQASSQLVVEGYIDNHFGPHVVHLSRASNIEADTIIQNPVSGASITLYEDRVKVADYVEVTPGFYIIDEGLFSGSVGHQYHIEIRTSDGHTYRSLQDELTEVGSINNIHTQYEQRSVLTQTGETNASVMKVLVDSKAGNGEQPLIRWRYSGYFYVTTYPMFFWRDEPPYTPYKDPWPCSGYIVVEGPPGSGGLLEQVGECTCCECWGRLYENAPTLSTEELVEEGNFANVLVGEVPVSPMVFSNRIMVKVEQMSLSRQAFDFFNIIRSQKENGQSIFQPAFGELKGNIVSDRSDDLVSGIFYATAINTQVIYIDSTDVPVNIPEETYITYPCTALIDDTSYDKPELWE